MNDKTSNDASNQRVTNTELRLGIEHLNENIDEYRGEVKEYRDENKEFQDRLIEVEKSQIAIDAKLDAVDNTVGDLRKRFNIWSSINTVGGLIVAGISTAFGIKQ